MSDEKEYLGDKVEKVLEKIGAKKVRKVFEVVSKDPCGCEKRKKRLNLWHKKQLEKRGHNERSGED